MEPLHLFAASQQGCRAGQICISPLPQVYGSGSEVQHIIQILFGVIGALAFLFMVIAGFRYVISSGDPQATAQAKNGLIYALIGVVLSLTAEAIVTWVIGQL